ncbi:MAG: peptide/nickel transport system permease protein [Thermomicrobiales bacterium]|jgi:peptide/nickel transport system permease protein|nr:peptide/nickel transport system permease protein [Thermomicrobiales bacterium]
MQSGFWAYLARRAIFLVPLLLGLSILMFLLIHAAPGDPVLAMMGERAASNPTYVEQTRKNLGLDKPLPVQYFYWLRRIVLHGDLGTAYTFNNKPVLTLIGERFWSTVQLQAIALFLGLAIAIPVGIISATRQYSTIDNTVTVGSFLGLALPNFWLALLLQVWIGVKLGWLPVISTGQADADYPGRIKYFIMPVIVLALPNIAYFARFMRSSMLEVINQDYVTVARAKGLDHQAVLYRHALRNALIPMVTVVGLQLPRILSGAVIIEQIFAWPGLGDLAYKAIGQRDYPVILAVTLLSGAAVMVVNLLTDLIYVLVDPRVSVTAGS